MQTLSFFPRKHALFTVGTGGRQPFVFARAADGEGFQLYPGTADGGTDAVACAAGEVLTLVFGPLWLSAYRDGALVWRTPRPDPDGPYQLAHDDRLQPVILAAEDALQAALDPLDRGQLLLLVGDAETALSLARGRKTQAGDDAGDARLLEVRAIRQAFAGHKQAAVALAAEGERAKALQEIGAALTLYAPLPAAPKPTDAGRAQHVVILADLSLPQCRHYRIDQKLEQLTAAGIPATVFDRDQTDAFMAAAKAATLALFYRLPLYPRIAEALAACRAAGVPCLFEIDDLLFDADAFPGPRAGYGADFGEAEYHELLILPPLYLALMTACDGAIASTPPLAAEMRRHMGSRPVHVHPNGLDSSHRHALEAAPKRAADGTVRLFYGSGTRALQQDFNALAAHVLAPLMAGRDTLRLTLAGHCDLPDSLTPFANRIDRLALQGRESYWQALSGTDINLAPLSPSRFNDCKSAIKWLEAAMFRIPSVVSTTETYKALLTDGDDGFLAADWQGWLAALETLADDAEARRRMGDKAYETAERLFGQDVLQRNMADIVEATEALTP